MSQLVTLREEPPDEVFPIPAAVPAGNPPGTYKVNTFLPTFEIDSAPAVDYTTGPNLRAYSDNNQYSTVLIDLIYQCLYQNPSNRPDLPELKKRIGLGLKASMTSPKQSRIDDWEDFLYTPFVDENPRPGFRKPGEKRKRAATDEPIPARELLDPNKTLMMCSLIIPSTNKQCRNQFRGRLVMYPECGRCEGTRDGEPKE